MMKEYRLAKITMKSILQSTHFKYQQDSFNDQSYRNSKLHFKIKNAVNLTSSVEVKEDEGIVIIVVDKLLEEK